MKSVSDLRPSGPPYQLASGGIEKVASSASIPTTASMSVALPGVHVGLDELA